MRHAGPPQRTVCASIPPASPRSPDEPARARRRGRRGPRAAAVVPLLLAWAAACGDATSPSNGRGPGNDVDLARLFEPPTAAERSRIESEWAERDLSVQDLEVVREEAGFAMGTGTVRVRIVSHTVAGVRHYGALAIPDGAEPASLPVLVYAHGGDEGVDVQELQLLGFALGALATRFVWVVPSFRSEAVRAFGSTYASGGTPSPWDRDVDDALALLAAALESVPEADPMRIGILGLSRGAGVALLMAAREPGVSLVVEFSGPTDFFDPWVRGIVEDALAGSVRDLPGLRHLDESFIQPLGRGALAVEDVRPELLRRSPVYFAERLPAVQLHHGTADAVVDVGQARSLVRAAESLGRSPPDFEAYLYDGGGHDPLTLPGSQPRATAFLRRLVDMTTVVAAAEPAR